MIFKEVYLSLGGNLGDTIEILKAVLKDIAFLPGIFDLKCSSFYQTTPVSDIPQGLYINAVCAFKTKLTTQELFSCLQEIERKHGKAPKPKNAPRVIDIDMLFFGQERHSSPDLEIPHPRWHERLFVLIPLAELTSNIVVPGALGDELKVIDINKIIATLRLDSKEKVVSQLSKENYAFNPT